MGRTRTLALLLLATTAGCVRGASPKGALPLPSAPAPWPSPGVELRRAAARPSVAIVARDGDPRAAVAIAVDVGAGSAASTALAAVVEKRLARAGLGAVDSRPDRDGYRVRVLLDAPSPPAAVVAAVEAALLAPVVAGSEEAALAGRRLAALRRRPLDDAALEPIAKCTGRLGALATEPAPDPTTAAGLATIESWRRAAHVAERISIGVVGPRAIGDAVAAAVAGSSGWPDAPWADEPWPAADATGLYVGATRAAGTARLEVALRVPDPRYAVAVAERAGDPHGPLVTRLGALPSPWRVLEVSATARPRGGCLAVTLETARPTVHASVLEAAAIAAALTRQELDGELSDALPDGPLAVAPDPWRTVRRATDPREAAALAAWWSFAARASAQGGEERMAVALEVPPAKVDPTPSAGGDAAARIAGDRARFVDELAQAERAFGEQVAERRVRVERGQGELWVLVGSPCGTLAEAAGDAGATALATIAAVAGRRGELRDVALEPWITADGLGVVAHGARRPGESSRAAAVRIADEAARTFVGPAAAFAQGRAVLLAEIGDDAGDDGRAVGAAAEALAPSHPSWLAPLGTWDAVTRLGDAAVSLRWSAVAAGPVRVAVLANESADEGDAVGRAVDRWMVRGLGEARACPAIDAPSPPRAGAFEVALGARAETAQAIVAFPAPSPGGADRALAELLVAAFDGPAGWLSHALASLGPGVTASARLAGGSRGAAMLLDVRSPDSAIEPAVAQVRALVQRIAGGAATADDLARASARRARAELESTLDPRRRLVDLWLDRAASAPGPAPTLEALRAFAAAALREDRTVLVVARPKR